MENGEKSIPVGMWWAVPGGSAIPGRPVSRQEQAPAHGPVPKRCLIIRRVTWTLSERSNSEEQILHLILARGAEKRYQERDHHRL